MAESSDGPKDLKKGWKYCRTCVCVCVCVLSCVCVYVFVGESPKPPRAHHCRICNRFVSIEQLSFVYYIIEYILSL